MSLLDDTWSTDSKDLDGCGPRNQTGYRFLLALFDDFILIFLDVQFYFMFNKARAIRDLLKKSSFIRKKTKNN